VFLAKGVTKPRQRPPTTSRGPACPWRAGPRCYDDRSARKRQPVMQVLQADGNPRLT